MSLVNFVKNNIRVAIIIIGLLSIFLLLLIPFQINIFDTNSDSSWFQLFVAHAQEPGWFERGLASTLSFFLSILTTVTGVFLSLTGVAFDQAIKYTIVNFSNTFEAFKPGVHITWAAFRDLSNIVLIAMFVYLAFLVILNITKYGLKQLGVRILIVALLINFSLFFTKAIIDISNITAVQFYNSITVVGGSNGISSAFMKQAGLSGRVIETGYATLKDITLDDKGGAGKAVVYALITSIFFIALAGVFAFAFILLISRMIVLIILMALSSLAFSAYIIPNIDSWWSRWWGALIKNAVFAPLFMALLWGTIQIIQTSSVSGDEGGASLADLIINKGAWDATFAMMIIIGLLYSSTIIANSLSLKASSYAKNTGIKTFGLGLRTGFSQLAGMGFRRAFLARNAGAKRLANLRFGANNRARARQRADSLNQFDKSGIGKQLLGLGFIDRDNQKETAKMIAKESMTEAKEAVDAMSDDDINQIHNESIAQQQRESQEALSSLTNTSQLATANRDANTLTREQAESQVARRTSTEAAANRRIQREQQTLDTARQQLQNATHQADRQRIEQQINAQEQIIENASRLANRASTERQAASQRVQFLDNTSHLNAAQQTSVQRQRDIELNNEVTRADTTLSGAQTQYNNIGNEPIERVRDNIRNELQTDIVRNRYGNKTSERVDAERESSTTDRSLESISSRINRLLDS